MEKGRRVKKSSPARSPRKGRRQQRKEEGTLGYSKVKLKTLRVAPRKARLVADQIRGKDLDVARSILEFSPRAVSKPMLTLLNSASANAEEVENLNVDNLFVSQVWVDGGPILKRFRPRAMGRASRINKRTCHITLVLREKED